MDIKCGETVRINSGGPTMTVRTVLEKSGIVICDWFDSADQDRQYSFYKEQLIVVPVPQSGVANV